MCSMMMMYPHLVEAAMTRGCGGVAKRRRFDFGDSESEYALRVDVPGAGPEDVELTVNDHGAMRLVVKNNERTLVDRELALPADADPSSVKASCAHGVLTVKINKLAKPAPVAVAVSDAALPDEANTSTSTEPYELVKNVPGTAAADVAVTIEDNETLRIAAGRYRAAYALPDDADAAAAKASCVHGVLTVRVPRAAPPLPHTVAVGATIPDDRHLDLARMSVPGFAPEDASVEVSGGAVRISLKKDGAERRGVVSLPRDVSELSFVHAAVANGVLQVWADAAAVRAPSEARIAVSTASPDQAAAAAMEEDGQQ